MNKTAQSFEKLFEVIKILHSPQGCPWDKDQTPMSMRNDIIEEAFETQDAITSGDAMHAKEELGDLLLNVLSVMYMYEMSGDFLVSDSLESLREKLIRRHPHVFKNQENISTDEVLTQWDKIKDNVEGRKRDSVLDQIPQGFPPLLKASKMIKKSVKKGFEWKNKESCFAKVSEELGEVEEAYSEVLSVKKTEDEKAFTVKSSNEELNKKQLHLEEEAGDLLFSAAAVVSYVDVDPVIALEKANRKYYRRFTYVEKKMKENNIPFDKEHIEEMKNFWKEAKVVK